VLGFLKGKTVKIKVRGKSAAQQMIGGIVKELFEKMGLPVEHKVTRGEDAYEIDLETDDADGLLIGRGGDTLKALQHLISRMVGHRDETLRVRVDVAGYRKRRQDQLRRKARDLAERALSQGRDAVSEPLPADERRIVHMALADEESVETRAIGEGQVKRVAVTPVAGRRAGTGSGRGQRGRRGGRSRPHSGGSGRGRPDQPRREDGALPAAASSDDGRAGEGSDRPRRHRVGERDRRRRRPGRVAAGAREAAPRPQSEPERTAEEKSDAGAEQPRREESQGETVPAERSWSDSYFNIPESVSRDENEKPGAGDSNGEADESKPMTWGRKRRPGRGRR
jgi:spoIIIJ-associated protein